MAIPERSIHRPGGNMTGCEWAGITSYQFGVGDDMAWARTYGYKGPIPLSDSG